PPVSGAEPPVRRAAAGRRVRAGGAAGVPRFAGAALRRPAGGPAEPAGGGRAGGGGVPPAGREGGGGRGPRHGQRVGATATGAAPSQSLLDAPYETMPMFEFVYRYDPADPHPAARPATPADARRRLEQGNAEFAGLLSGPPDGRLVVYDDLWAAPDPGDAPVQ